MMQQEQPRRDRGRSEQPRGTARILVVDDDIPQRGLLASALKQSGYHVLLAGDGNQAQTAISLHAPDVVLLDLMMPGVNGWELLQRLKNDGVLERTPVVVVSAHLHTDPKSVLDMGASALLPKPIQLDDLLCILQHLIRD